MDSTSRITESELMGDALFIDCLRLNDVFVREIYEEMNGDNYYEYLNTFDIKLTRKWLDYAKAN